VPSAVPSTAHQIEPPPPPEINRTLIEGMVLRIASSATRVTGFEVAEALALPFVAIEPILKALTGTNFLDALGLAQEQGPWLGGPIVLPVALDVGGGEVMTIFDGAVHRLEPNQPADRRWRRIARPLVQVGGEFQLEMFDSTWEDGSRVYSAPLQVKANGGVLLIDDLGRQRVSPKQILDRLLVPLEQDTDFLNLSASGRKVEIPFRAQLALSTNLKPA